MAGGGGRRRAQRAACAHRPRFDDAPHDIRLLQTARDVNVLRSSEIAYLEQPCSSGEAISTKQRGENVRAKDDRNRCVISATYTYHTAVNNSRLCGREPKSVVSRPRSQFSIRSVVNQVQQYTGLRRPDSKKQKTSTAVTKVHPTFHHHYPPPSCFFPAFFLKPL